MVVKQVNGLNASEQFPNPEEISRIFSKSKAVHGEVGFIMSHNNLISITTDVLKAVTLSQDEIPKPLASLLAQEIMHFINAENSTFDSFHGGVYLQLTYASKRALDLVLTSSSADQRLISAELGLQAIEALNSLASPRL